MFEIFSQRKYYLRKIFSTFLKVIKNLHVKDSNKSFKNFNCKKAKKDNCNVKYEIHQKKRKTKLIISILINYLIEIIHSTERNDVFKLSLICILSDNTLIDCNAFTRLVNLK